MINVLLVFFATLSISFGIGYFSIADKLRKLSVAFGEMILANDLLEAYIDKNKSKISTDDETVHKENFIKFLSDSRDWAFGYIEEVQEGLESFVSEIEPEINYFKEYGDVAASAPNYYSMKKIVESYEKLKTLLPEESE